MKLFSGKSIRMLAPLILGGALVATIACGGETEVVRETVVVTQAPEVRTEVQTVVVEKEVAGEKVVETVVVEKEKVVEKEVVQTVEVEKQVVETVEVEKVVTATPPPQPQGEVIIGVRQIGPGAWLNRNSHPSELSTQLGTSEGFFMPDPDDPDEDTGMLVESWELAGDLSKVTLKLHEGVQFHGGWGEMTAQDAAWSVNDANAGLTAGAVHGQSGDLRLMFNEWTAVDKYTLDAPFNQFDATWRRGLLNVWFESVDVLSKKVYNDLGPEVANETRIATGPFRVQSWVQGDRIVGEAVADHWRVKPTVQRFILRAIPEESAQVAAIKTGEIDIAEIAILRNVQDLRNSGIEMNAGTNERQSPAILFAGNLWQESDPLTGEPLDRPGFDPDLPWIGDPDAPGCDRERLFNNPSPDNICESMDNARKVRLAMAMAIDREAINDVILDELGVENPLPWYSKLNSKLWEDRWDVPFDPERGRELLAEAGYPDGFEVTPNLYHSQIYGPAPVSKAVASMWRDNLGLTVTVDLQAYSTFRPSIVERSRSGPWMSGCNYGRNLPADWPIGSLSSALSRGGFSCGFEAPFYSDLFLEMAQEADPLERIRLKKELGDLHRFWMLTAGTVEVPGLWAVNPDTVVRWNLRRGFKNTLNSLETIIVDK